MRFADLISARIGPRVSRVEPLAHLRSGGNSGPYAAFDSGASTSGTSQERQIFAATLPDQNSEPSE